MSDAPYIPFFTSDFLGGTSGLTSSVKGVYITLLCLMYETEAPLTQSWDTLARRSGCTPSSFRKALDVLVDDGKITVTDEGIWSEKCDKHITQRRERSGSAKAAAKKRWEKPKQKQRQTDATAMRPQCQPEPEPEPEVKNPPNPQRGKVERFQEFWDNFPHRGGAKKDRKKSEARYARAVKSGTSEQEIISAAIRYHNDAQVQRGYGSGPLPWLNGEKWNDEIERNQPQQQAGQSRRGGTHDALLAGFGSFAHGTDTGGGFDDGGSEAASHTGDAGMDDWTGCGASQPLLRVVNP